VLEFRFFVLFGMKFEFWAEIHILFDMVLELGLEFKVLDFSDVGF
jgi:hypothetical protein